VVYRKDATGARVGVTPATCRRGEHALHQVGYRAHVADTGILKISCNACHDRQPPRFDHYWSLRLDGLPPDRAELDDGPYQDLLTKFVEEAEARERRLSERR
jgi:hypothetical protein